jgi:hypothetical protein
MALQSSLMVAPQSSCGKGSFSSLQMEVFGSQTPDLDAELLKFHLDFFL